jgi:serine/threonine protein kinase
MLNALRKHRSIVDIYGHQFSSKWVQDDSDKEYRIMQSVILMEYVKGGSLKVNAFVHVYDSCIC